MMNPRPAICVNVDVTNPGQFFACCGMLELASRIDYSSTGLFEKGRFFIKGDVHAVLHRFFECEVRPEILAVPENDDEADELDEKDEVDPHRGRTYPMTLGDPFDLKLDWWNNEEAQGQKLKTWTAGQRVTDLLLGYHKKQKRKGKVERKYLPSMREHFAEAVRRCPNDWLREPWPIEVPDPFNYDSRLSRRSALDLGHTADNVMAFSPAVDVLTLVALQRFRPRMLEIWTRNLYCTWNQPLPVEVAAVAALGLIPCVIADCFEFPIKPRDSQGRYKLFGHAQRIRRRHA